MKEIGIGLLGFGTVGAGVVRGLKANGDLVAQRLGARLVLRKIADIDLESDRGIAVDSALLTTDAAAVIDDPAVDVVVELIGGTGPARDLVVQALQAGKPVVTANKALLAEHGAEIFGLAREHNAGLFFEASVAGGVPIIRALQHGLVANRIERIYGILNGTCNYILTRMEQEHVSFEDVLAQAQAEGYAEADPSLDIDGIDTAHKAVVLGSLVSGSVVPMASVHVEGIRGLAEADIEYALDMGYRIKMLAIIKPGDDELELRVHPTLVPVDHLLASVSGVFNAVMVTGDMTGETVYYGRGAGQDPTASAVIGDIADAARRMLSGANGPHAVLPGTDSPVSLRSMDAVESRYYLRLTLEDRAGVLAQIATILGEHDISIASAMQKERLVSGYVPVVLVTHRASDRQMNAALEAIDSTAVVGAGTVRIRIEDRKD